MAGIQTGFFGGLLTGLTKGVTNPAAIAVPVVALSDGEGNLLGSDTNEPTTFLTYPSAAQAVSNAGTSFSTALVQGLALDITLTSFTAGTAPTVTFFVDRFGADGVWYRTYASVALSTASVISAAIGAVSALTTVTATALVEGVPAILTSLARFGWSSTGAPTAITFSASVIGR